MYILCPNYLIVIFNITCVDASFVHVGTFFDIDINWIELKNMNSVRGILLYWFSISSKIYFLILHFDITDNSSNSEQDDSVRYYIWT